MPEEGDRQPDDRQREEELHHGDAGAFEVEIVRAEVAEEKPQSVGYADLLLVHFEHHLGPHVCAKAGLCCVHGSRRGVVGIGISF